MDDFKNSTKTKYSSVPEGARRQINSEVNDMGASERTRALKTLGRPATPPPKKGVPVHSSKPYISSVESDGDTALIAARKRGMSPGFAKGGKVEYKNQRMTGQDPRDKGMYRFKGDAEKGTARMHPDDYKVMVDIDERDRKDIYNYRDKGAKATKLDKMAHDDAVQRQNKLGTQWDGADGRDTGRGFKRGGKVR